MHDAMTLFGALARGELPTRAPITANLPDQGLVELGIAAREYYNSPDNVQATNLALTFWRHNSDGSL